MKLAPLYKDNNVSFAPPRLQKAQPKYDKTVNFCSMLIFKISTHEPTGSITENTQSCCLAFIPYCS